MLLWILVATIVDSLLGFIGVITLWVNDKLLNRISLYFVAFSAGALLGGAFYHLLPESLERLSMFNVFSLTLGGFILFMLIEGYFHWHQCHKCKIHPFSYLMLIGDGIHNFIDGLVIAAAFLISIKLGIITTLMIMFHEAPQELGLFGVLLYGGFDKKRSLLYSFIAQLTVILGGITGYLLSNEIGTLSSLLIPFAAGGFIYIASSDLIPQIHETYRGNLKKSVLSLLSLLIGTLLMIFIRFLGE